MHDGRLFAGLPALDAAGEPSELPKNRVEVFTEKLSRGAARARRHSPALWLIGGLLSSDSDDRIASAAAR
jgi:hypothetical protein